MPWWNKLFSLRAAGSPVVSARELESEIVPIRHVRNEALSRLAKDIAAFPDGHKVADLIEQADHGGDVWGDLYDVLCHQGSPNPVSYVVAPYLAQAAMGTGPIDRQWVATILGDLVAGSRSDDAIPEQFRDRKSVV